MNSYEPAKPIVAEEWLALDELQRTDLVHEYHEALDEDMPDDALSMHTTVHVIVENQLAMGVELIPETMAKLLRQGLDRHDAIHAIGAIIFEDIFDVFNENSQELSPKKQRRRLEKITAKRWRKGQY